MTAEEIAGDIPHLTVTQVYAALAYYHANRAAMEEEMAAEEAESDEFERDYLRKKKTAR